MLSTFKNWNFNPVSEVSRSPLTFKSPCFLCNTILDSVFIILRDTIEIFLFGMESHCLCYSVTCLFSSTQLSVQCSSVAQSCPTLCDPMNRSTPGFPVHQHPEFTQTHTHRVGDAIQPSHPLSSPSPAPNPSQHQSLFQWVNSSH